MRRDHRGFGAPASEQGRGPAPAPAPAPEPPSAPAPSASAGRRPASRVFVTRATTRSFASRRPKTALPRKAFGVARAGAGRVRWAGRLRGAAAGAVDSLHFTLETAPGERRRVHLVGEAAVARARALADGARVVVDGRVVGANALLLAYALRPVTAVTEPA